MPTKIKQEDGTEIEVFTQAELEEQATQRAEAAAAKAREEAEAESAAKLEELNTELEKERTKEKNFKALRESKAGVISEEVTKQIQDLSKKISDITQQPINEVRDSFKKVNYGEDKDLNTKFDYYSEKLRGEAKTREEILKAATEAHTLVTGGQKPNMDFNMFGARISPNYVQQKDDQSQPSERKRQIASDMGLSEADLKKYGKKK